MRRVDRQMDEAFALDVMDRCEFAVLSMVGEEGTPYSVPLSIAREDKHLYFHCALQGKKSDILRHNPAVCVVCVSGVKPAPMEFSTEYESAIATGRAVEVTGEEEKIHALRLICQRYAAENMAAFNTRSSVPQPGAHRHLACGDGADHRQAQKIRRRRQGAEVRPPG